MTVDLALENIPVIMRHPFFGHRQDSLLHILDVEEMVKSPYWDIVKCGKMGLFKEAIGKEQRVSKCAECFKEGSKN